MGREVLRLVVVPLYSIHMKVFFPFLMVVGTLFPTKLIQAQKLALSDVLVVREADWITTG